MIPSFWAECAIPPALLERVSKVDTHACATLSVLLLSHAVAYFVVFPRALRALSGSILTSWALPGLAEAAPHPGGQAGAGEAGQATGGHADPGEDGASQRQNQGNRAAEADSANLC